MIYTDRYFCFPDRATADLLMPPGTFANMDSVGHTSDAAGILEKDWCINVRPLEGEMFTAAQIVYEIPAPKMPERQWAAYTPPPAEPAPIPTDVNTDGESPNGL